MLGICLWLLDMLEGCNSWLNAQQNPLKVRVLLQVPALMFQLSAAAFASSFTHNLTSFTYEASGLKKKLALLQCLIKAVSFLADVQLGFGRAPVFADSAGRP